MNDRERAERAHRAQRAMEEFFEPAFAVVEETYTQKIIDAAASTDPRTPEIIARLANGIKAARSARAQIEAIIADGGVARSAIEQAEREDEMTPAKLRLLKIGR